MTLRRPLWLAAAALALAACGVKPAALPVPRPAGVTATFGADGLALRHVALKPRGRALPALLTTQKAGGPTVVARLQAIGWLIVDLGAEADARRRALAQDAAVEVVEPLRLVKAEGVANDPRLPEQYQLAVGHAIEAWELHQGDPATTIAIIDTGIDMGHPDLAPKLDAASWNVFKHSHDVRDAYGHGTHTAGIAAAIAGNGEGGAGVAPKAGLMAVKVLDNRATGTDATTAEGVLYAVDHGAKVISLSLGFYKRSKVLEEALQYALDHDVVVVASAGNNNEQNDPVSAPHLPSTHPGVIEVAATDAKDQKAPFSNFGKTVSVAAPGVDVLSTLPTYEEASTIEIAYGKLSGTSMAAPFVAGVAALVRAQRPELGQAAVKARIEATADDLGPAGFDPVFGHGRVNAARALAR